MDGSRLRQRLRQRFHKTTAPHSNAQISLLFVATVSCVLLVGAGTLVIAASLQANRDTPLERTDRPAAERRSVEHPPTGSSIDGAAPRLSATAPTTSPPPTSSTSLNPSQSPTAPSATSTASASATSPRATGSGGTPMAVSYEVTGSGTVTELTYWRADHDVASEHTVALPWFRSVILAEPGTIRLYAQVKSGIVHCRLSVDGQVVSEEAQEYYVNCEAALHPAVHDG